MESDASQISSTKVSVFRELSQMVFWYLACAPWKCHAALSVSEFLASHSIPMVPHQHHSLDFYFLLFSSLMITMKQKQF